MQYKVGWKINSNVFDDVRNNYPAHGISFNTLGVKEQPIVLYEVDAEI